MFIYVLQQLSIVLLLYFNLKPFNVDIFISILLSILIGVFYYKFLQIEKKYYWIFIFGLIFYLMDSYAMDMVIKFIGKAL